MDAMKDLGVLIFVLIIVFIFWVLFAPKDNPDIVKGPFIKPVGVFGGGEVYGPSGTPEDIIKNAPKGWALFETQKFYIALPSNWTFRKFETSKSNVYSGEFRTKNMVLTYEYSGFASPLIAGEDSRYKTKKTKISGRGATIIQSRSEIGITGIYFPATKKGNRLSVSGFNLTKEQKNLAMTIFSTIKFK